jgi:hypothetical protein
MDGVGVPLRLRHLLSAAALALASEDAAAEPAAAPLALAFDAGGERRWQHLAFPGRPATRFVAESSATLRVRATMSASLLYRPVEPWAGTHRRLAWRWRVERAAAATDLARRGGDDRSLALYAVFAPETAPSWTQRLGAAIGLAPSELLDRGFILVYVWGGTAPRGSIVASPYAPERVRLITREPAAGSPLGAWRAETADLVADFRRAFGREPPALRYVAVAADTDDTGGDAEAAISDLVLAPR